MDANELFSSLITVTENSIQKQKLTKLVEDLLLERQFLFSEGNYTGEPLRDQKSCKRNGQKMKRRRPNTFGVYKCSALYRTSNAPETYHLTTARYYFQSLLSGIYRAKLHVIVCLP